MKYKTYWLSAICAPMLIHAPVHAIQTQLAASHSHTIFIDNGSVFAMGSNAYRQSDPSQPITVSNPVFAQGDKVMTPKFTGVNNAKSVAAKARRSVALTNNGEAILWGNLTGTTIVKPYSLLPSKVIQDVAMTLNELFYVIDGTINMWDFKNPSIALNDPKDGKVIAISAGSSHILALFENGTVASYGTSNTYGQLGHGNKTVPKVLTKLPNIVGAVEILAQSDMSFIRDAKQVFSFGNSGHSQTGNGSAPRLAPTVVAGLTNVTKMAGNYASAFMLMKDGTIKASGWHNYISGAIYNRSYQFTTLPGITNANDMDAGGQQIFVNLGTPGVVRGWGGNGTAQLGDNTITERHNLSYAYYTPIEAPKSTPTPSAMTSPFAPTPIVPPPTITIVKAPVAVAPISTTSMNDCIKSTSEKGAGQLCKTIIVDPKYRGNGNTKN